MSEMAAKKAKLARPLRLSSSEEGILNFFLWCLLSFFTHGGGKKERPRFTRVTIVRSRVVGWPIIHQVVPLPAPPEERVKEPVVERNAPPPLASTRSPWKMSEMAAKKAKLARPLRLSSSEEGILNFFLWCLLFFLPMVGGKKERPRGTRFHNSKKEGCC